MITIFNVFIINYLFNAVLLYIVSCLMQSYFIQSCYISVVIPALPQECGEGVPVCVGVP